jgi:alpha-L-fucosidase
MKQNNRSIYGCGAAQFTPPPDCRYTQNGKRLYLHFMDWPFGEVHLPGLADLADYAQFLHDGSEVGRTNNKIGDKVGDKEYRKGPPGSLTLKMPVVKPNVEIPVIEIFLK